MRAWCASVCPCLRAWMGPWVHRCVCAWVSRGGLGVSCIMFAKHNMYRQNEITAGTAPGIGAREQIAHAPMNAIHFLPATNVAKAAASQRERERQKNEKETENGGKRQTETGNDRERLCTPTLTHTAADTETHKGNTNFERQTGSKQALKMGLWRVPWQAQVQGNKSRTPQ
jgi:hypothetical protein